MKYAIMVRERGSDHVVELCRVSTNPRAIEEAARRKTVLVDLAGNGKKKSIPKFEHVEIREIADA